MPAAVSAPLLLALGFPAMAAVMTGLIIQSTPVSFGAVGLPLNFGVLTGLQGGEPVEALLSERGITLQQYVVDIITPRVAILHAAAGMLIPLFLACMITGFFGRNRNFGEGLGVWKFALFASFAFLIPYVIYAFLLGPAFPSLLGAPTGLLIVVFAARRGFLLPQETWDFGPRSEWEAEWTGSVSPDDLSSEVEGERMGTVRAWAPYLVLALLLLISRIPQSLNDFLSGVTIAWENIFGVEGISWDFAPIYNPGFMLLLAVAVTYVIHRMNFQQISTAWGVAGRQVLGAGFVLVLVLPLVRVFINSGEEFNSSGLASMPLTLSQGVAAVAGQSWPFFAPWIGALGAFIAGSNTVSNLTFSLFQFSTAQNVGATASVVVAAQAVGGAAGNMITVHNVVAASATTGLLGREGALIRKTIIPMTYYLLLTGSLAFIWIYGIGFNLGTVALVLVIAALIGLAVIGNRRNQRQREQTYGEDSSQSTASEDPPEQRS